MNRQRPRSTVKPRLAPLLLFLAAAVLYFVIAAPGALAASGQVSAQFQGYGDAAPGGQDPYAGDNPQDVHVDGFGGQPVVNGYLRLNLDSLPSGSTINGLQLKLVPNSSQMDNVESGMAAVEACGLTQPLASSGYQANPPTYDCTVHAVGEPQTDGSWIFELQPLAQKWTQGQNDGLALVAYPPPTGTPVTQVYPSAWSVGFDHTKSTAAVDYTPGILSSSSFFSGPVAPAPVSVSGGGAVVPAPPANPAPLPSVATPTPAASAATPAPAAVATQPAAPARGGGQWVWIAGALLGAALLMVVVTASQQVLRGGSLNLVGRTGAALAASRSQLATPVAVLALASVFALGFSGQLVGTSGPGGGNAPGSTSGGGGAAGGSGGSGVSGAPGSGSGGALGGGGTSSGQPGLAGGSGNAAAAAAASTNGGLDGPGVTSTTVRIGFVYLTNSQAANNAFGFTIANAGDPRAQDQAMVDYLNKHGGIGGRQIQPVYVAEDVSQGDSDPTIGEEICRTMTEDYHVFAVVAGGGPPDDANANACYAEHSTINFDVQWNTPDLTFLKQASPYIWLMEDAAVDRMMRWEVSGLQSRGYFTQTPGYKLGVVIADDPVNRQRVWPQVTLPALEAAGFSAQQIDTFYVPHDTLSDLANTMKQAVVHFQVDGVTNVMFQGGGGYGGGSYAVLFMVDSESQHYNPRYGLSSDDGTGALVSNVPQDQFKGALSVGTAPGLDTDDQHYGQWPYTRDQKTCAALEAAAGNSVSSQQAAIQGMAPTCDSMFLLQEGAQALTGQALNAQLWADQAMKLGSSVFNTGLYARTIGPGHWDGAGGYRLLHAVLNCNGGNACFAYDNSNVYG